MIWLAAAVPVAFLAGLFAGFGVSFPAGFLCGRTHTHTPEWLPVRVRALAHMQEQEASR